MAAPRLAGNFNIVVVLYYYVVRSCQTKIMPAEEERGLSFPFTEH